MGYMVAMGPCYGCGRIFGFNSELVPSIPDEHGIWQPICRDCVERANVIRQERGLAPIQVLPGAYEGEEV